MKRKGTISQFNCYIFLISEASRWLRVSIKPLSRIEVAAKEATRQILSASKVTRFPGEQWKAIHYLIFKLASAHLTACLHGSPGHDKAVQSPPPTRIALRSAGRVLQIIDESKDEEEDNRSSKEGLVAATKQFRAWLSTLSARGLDYKRLLSPHRVLRVGELLAELGEFGQSVRLMDQSFPPPPPTTTTTKKSTATKQPSTAASRITTAVTSILNRIVALALERTNPLIPSQNSYSSRSAPSSSSTDIEGNQGGEKKNPEEGAVPPGIVVDLLEAKGRILIKELYSSTYVTDRAADRRSLSNAVQSAREAKLSQKRRLSAFEAKDTTTPYPCSSAVIRTNTETLGRALALAGQYGFMISGFISRRSALEAFNEADRELKYCINTWRRRVDGEELQGQGEMSVKCTAGMLGEVATQGTWQRARRYCEGHTGSNLIYAAQDIQILPTSGDWLERELLLMMTMTKTMMMVLVRIQVLHKAMILIKIKICHVRIEQINRPEEDAAAVRKWWAFEFRITSRKNSEFRRICISALFTGQCNVQSI
eukprot:jgi/Bigna1/140724/aug1.58_g15432